MSEGGQIGNNNATKGKKFNDALKLALTRKSNESYSKGLALVADELVKAAVDEGQQWAIKEIADRTDGKPAQAINVGGQEDNPLKTIHEVLIKPLTNDSGND